MNFALDVKDKSVPHIKFKIRRVINDFRSGIHHSIMSGKGMDFKGIRAYDPSDSLTQVDWFASARLSDDDTELVSRDYHPEREVAVVCVVDNGHSMETPEQKKQHARILTWLFAFSAFKNRDRFRIVLPSASRIQSSEWIWHEEGFDSIVWSTEHTDLFPFLAGLDLANTLLVFISDFGPDWVDEAPRLRRLDPYGRNIKSIFLALDEWSGFKPTNYSITFHNPGENDMQRMDLRFGGSAEQESQEQRKRFAKIASSIRPFGVPFIPISLLDDPLKGARRALIKEGFE